MNNRGEIRDMTKDADIGIPPRVFRPEDAAQEPSMGRFIRADTSTPRGTWDVCWPANTADDGVLVVDVSRPMTVRPAEWPKLPDGYAYFVIRGG